jgi:predicted NUDIX family phosphoesterase
MAKLALCIDTKEHTLPINQWKPRLIDRVICETDESTLQIIPYVVLRDIATHEIFSYTRGNAGQEDRLHSKISIGVGGHIDDEIKSNLIELIAEEAVREIEEETGFKANPQGIIKDLIKGDYIKLYTPNAEKSVDRVHIGIAFTIDVNKKDLIKLEDGVILNPRWLSLSELSDNVKSSFCNLENWSKMLCTVN